MSWILATDVNDGERLAFPQSGTLVSFDFKAVRQMIEDLRERNAKAEKTTKAMDSVEPMDDGQRAQFEANVEAARSTIKRWESAEGFVIFHGTRYFVRGMKLATRWEEVEEYTRRTDPTPVDEAKS